MKKGIVMKRMILIAIVLVLLLSACSSPSSKIVGTWKGNDGATYTFNKEKVVLVKPWGTGTYEFIDEKTIMITFDGLLGLAGGLVYDVEFSGKNLLLTINEVTTTLTRE